MDVTLTKGTFHSFTAPFEWKGIPSFAVITGRNGVGKTHLLRLVHSASTSGGASTGPTLTGAAFDSEAVCFQAGALQFNENPPIVGPAELSGKLQSLAVQIAEVTSRNPTAVAWRHALFGMPVTQIPVGAPKEIHERLPIAACFSHSMIPMHILGDFAIACIGYRLRSLELIDKDRSSTEGSIEALIGPPPWRVMDEVLSAAGLGLRTVTPKEQPLTQQFVLRFQHASGAIVTAGQCSSGEQAILGLALILVGSKFSLAVPRLLLLDEPDVHLHSALIPGFIRAIEQVLVRRYGATVIMTTHRPDTVLLAPDDCLFELQSTPHRISPVSDKAAVLATLSGSVLALMPNVRCILVEDDDDAEAHATFLQTAVGAGCVSRDARCVFTSANPGKGSAKTGGGCHVVRSWVGKLRDSGLAPLVQGLIDADAGNKSGNGITVLPRHSVENFLCDPMCLVAALIDANHAEAVGLQGFGPGDENRLVDLDQSDLQACVDRLAESVGGSLTPPFDEERCTIAYANERSIIVPKAWLDRRGHDLHAACVQALGGSVVSRKRLLQAFRRLRWVPKDLAECLTSLCADSELAG